MTMKKNLILLEELCMNGFTIYKVANQQQTSSDVELQHNIMGAKRPLSSEVEFEPMDASANVDQSLASFKVGCMIMIDLGDW